MGRRIFVLLEKIFLGGMLAISILLPIPFFNKWLVVYCHLLVGWLFFLHRALPQVEIDPIGLGLAGGSLLALFIGVHYFCRWLHKEIRLRTTPATQAPDASPPIWSWRTTCCLLGLTVMMFAAGTAAVGTVHQIIWLWTRPVSY